MSDNDITIDDTSGGELYQPDEVKLLIVELAEAPSDENEGNVSINAIAAAFDLNRPASEGGRHLSPDERPADMNEFVADVLADMEKLITHIAVSRAENLHQRTLDGNTAELAEVYTKLLASFLGRPVELMGNMLASMLFGLIESVLDAPDFDEAIAELKGDVTPT